MAVFGINDVDLLHACAVKAEEFGRNSTIRIIEVQSDESFCGSDGRGFEVVKVTYVAKNRKRFYESTVEVRYYFQL